MRLRIINYFIEDLNFKRKEQNLYLKDLITSLFYYFENELDLFTNSKVLRIVLKEGVEAENKRLKPSLKMAAHQYKDDFKSFEIYLKVLVEAKEYYGSEIIQTKTLSDWTRAFVITVRDINNIDHVEIIKEVNRLKARRD